MPSPRRAPRPALAPASVVEAALRIVDTEGVAALTVRRLSSELGVTPMAIYHHFENKADLSRRMVEHVVREAAVREVPRDRPDVFLRETFTWMHRGLAAHPGILPLLSGPDIVGEHGRAVMRGVLDVLRDAGLGPAARNDAYYLLMSYTLGAVTMDHASAAAPSRFERGLRKLVDAVLARAG